MTCFCFRHLNKAPRSMLKIRKEEIKSTKKNRPLISVIALMKSNKSSSLQASCEDCLHGSHTLFLTTPWLTLKTKSVLIVRPTRKPIRKTNIYSNSIAFFRHNVWPWQLEKEKHNKIEEQYRQVIISNDSLYSNIPLKVCLLKGTLWATYSTI